MQLRVCMHLSLALLISSASAAPEAVLPLPQLAACERAAPPRLPERWRGTYLMAPFGTGQLVLADILHDAALPAMRVKLLGVKGGSVDLLVTGKKTYALSRQGSAVADCRDLGDTGWRPLPQDWLTARSQCMGSAPLGEVPVEWWRTAIAPEPASDWVWHKTADRSPFRLVFPFATNRLPPLSRYALSYQVSFEPLAQSDLAAVVSACNSARPAARTGARALQELIAFMERSRERADEDIARLMPGLAPSCSAAPFPEWPHNLAVTGLMTPYDSDEAPYPAEVLYDWAARAQRTRIFGGPGDAFTAQDFLLLDRHGFTVTHHRPQGLTCEPVVPGAIRPDWASRAPCQCAAEINEGTPLSPHGATRILKCPLASPRVAWAWYARSGRPTTFMVTARPGDEGKGLLAVLDYGDWSPGQRAAPSTFDRPAECAPSRTRQARPASLNQCSTCHLGRRP